eukprot:IDg9678t1
MILVAQQASWHQGRLLLAIIVSAGGPATRVARDPVSMVECGCVAIFACIYITQEKAVERKPQGEAEKDCLNGEWLAVQHFSVPNKMPSVATADTEMSGEPSAAKLSLPELLARAEASTNSAQAEADLRAIIASDEKGDVAARAKESSIAALAAILVKDGRAAEVVPLSKEIRPFFAKVAKAKTAKIVRGLLDTVSRGGGDTNVQLELCTNTIEWCRAERRTFLRQRVQGRLVVPVSIR